MKTAIVYYSKYDFCKECANDLSTKLEDYVDIFDISDNDNQPNTINEYDTVIFGTSIYFGKINKRLVEFCKKNVRALTNKRIAFFVCCATPSEYKTALLACLPKDFVENIDITECFGGELRKDKMRFKDKIIANTVEKVLAKENKEPVQPRYENIITFAERINS